MMNNYRKNIISYYISRVNKKYFFKKIIINIINYKKNYSSNLLKIRNDML